MSSKKFLLGVSIILCCQFIYIKAIAQNTPAQWAEIRRQREADEARRRQQQADQEKERQKKANTKSTSSEKYEPVEKSTNKTTSTPIEDDGMHYTSFDEISKEVLIDNLQRARVGQKYGYINKFQKIVIPIIYDDAAESFKAGMLVVKKNDLWGGVDETGKIIIPLMYDQIGDFVYNTAPVKKNNKWGCVSNQGVLLIECLYDDVTLNINGARILLNNKYGLLSIGTGSWEKLPAIYDYIDFNGTMVLMRQKNLYGFYWSHATECKYDYIGDFISDVAVVSAKNKKGIVNRQGKEIVPLKYEDVLVPEENFAGIKLNGKWGFYNTENNTSIVPQFDKIKQGFTAGKAFVIKNKEEYYIDKTGKRLAGKPVIVKKIPIDHTYTFTDGLAPFSDNNGHWGFVDKTGKIIIPCKYEMPYGKTPQFSEDKLNARINYKWGYINKSGETIVGFDYDQAEPYKDGFASVKSGDKWGLLDASGKIVIPIVCQDQIYLIGGVIGVKYDNKYGFFNTALKQITPFKYDNWGKDNTTAWRDGKWERIDPMTSPIPDPTPLIAKYFFSGKEKIGELYEGRAVVEDESKFGFVDKHNKLIVPLKYKGVYHFSEGLAAVKLDKYWGYIDTSGNVITEMKYTDVGYFHNGFAEVTPDLFYGFINKTGKLVVPAIYKEIISGFSMDGIAVVSKDGKAGFIDTVGNEFIPFIYDKAQFFTEGVAAVKVNDKWTFIDKTGKMMFPPIYQWLGYLRKGVAYACLNKKWGFVNERGEEIVPIIYDATYEFDGSGTAAVVLNGKKGLVNRVGKLIVPLKYDDIGYYAEGLMAVKSGKKWGYINSEGVVIIPIIYEEADYFKNGKARVILYDEYLYIDKTGAKVNKPD